MNHCKEGAATLERKRVFTKKIIESKDIIGNLPIFMRRFEVTAGPCRQLTFREFAIKCRKTIAQKL